MHGYYLRTIPQSTEWPKNNTLFILGHSQRTDNIKMTKFQIKINQVNYNSHSSNYYCDCSLSSPFKVFLLIIMYLHVDQSCITIWFFFFFFFFAVWKGLWECRQHVPHVSSEFRRQEKLCLHFWRFLCRQVREFFSEFRPQIYMLFFLLTSYIILDISWSDFRYTCK